MANKVNKIANQATLNEDGIVYSHSLKVCCEGPLGSRHPKVFLQLKEPQGEGMKHHSKISCPYCGQVFIYKK